MMKILIMRNKVAWLRRMKHQSLGRFILLSLIAIVVVVNPSRSAAVNVTICDEVELLTTHPAEYALEKIKRGGLSCLAHPVCCTVGWPLDPFCYIEKWVLRQNAWDEIGATFTCQEQDLDAETVWRRMVTNLSDPVPGFDVFPTEAISTLLGGYVQELYKRGRTVPTDVRGKLNEISISMTLPFSMTDVDNVRWVPASDRTARIIFPSSAIAITYYDLIIVDESAFAPVGTTEARFTNPNDDLCARTALWAHEMVHVEQYHRAGWNNFLNQWALDVIQAFGDIDHYNRLATEAPAFQVMQEVFNLCLRVDDIFTILTPRREAIRAKALTLKRLNEWKKTRDSEWKKRQPEISKLQDEGELTVIAGRIVDISDRAKEELSELIPSANLTPRREAIRAKALALKRFNEWKKTRDAEWKKRKPEKAKRIEALVSKLQDEGELTVIAGRIEDISDRAKEELSELIPSANFYVEKLPKLMLQMKTKKLTPEPRKSKALDTCPCCKEER